MLLLALVGVGSFNFRRGGSSRRVGFELRSRRAEDLEILQGSWVEEDSEGRRG